MGLEQEKKGKRGRRRKHGPNPAALSRLWEEPGFYSVKTGKVLVAFKLGRDRSFNRMGGTEGATPHCQWVGTVEAFDTHCPLSLKL